MRAKAAGASGRAAEQERGRVRVERAPDPTTSAEEEAMQSIGRASLLELIEDLSPDQRQVLTLKFVFDFSNAEVARILRKSEGAIKSLQHRALASLHRRIG